MAFVDWTDETQLVTEPTDPTPEETFQRKEHARGLAEKAITELLWGKWIELTDLGERDGRFFCKGEVIRTHMTGKSHGPSKLDARINVVKILETQISAWRMVNDLPMPSFNYIYANPYRTFGPDQAVNQPWNRGII